MLIMNTVRIAFARVDDNETPGDRLSVAGVLDVCIAVREWLWSEITTHRH